MSTTGMLEAFKRLFKILTGIYPTAITNDWTIGTGTLNYLYVALGYETLNKRLPNKRFFLILDDLGESKERVSQGAFNKVYRIQVELIMEISGNTGALIGKGSDKGILDAWEDFETLITSEANVRLTDAAQSPNYYTDILEIPLNVESFNAQDETGIIFARMRRAELIYKKLMFTEE